MSETNDGCVFYKAWRGECGGKPVTETAPQLCSEHVDKTCVVCGGQATTQCGSAGSLVCGRPLCETCECPGHNVTGHGAGRDFGQEEEVVDIIAAVVPEEYDDRYAEGTVNGTSVTVSKAKHEHQDTSAHSVRVVTEDDDAESELFDDEDEADEYFETLVDRYDLVEIECGMV